MDRAATPSAERESRLARTLVLPTGMTMVFSCAMPARNPAPPAAVLAIGDEFPEPDETPPG
jgi:hypothetical protein